jgi:DNA (cytosine-5)-methyltransferase 1
VLESDASVDMLKGIGTRSKLISLFAGAGGLDIGLEHAGFETVVANDIEPHACETLRRNQELSILSPNQLDAWLDIQMRQLCYKGNEEVAKRDLRNRLKNYCGNRFLLHRAKIVEQDIRSLSSDRLLQLSGCKRGEVDLIAGGPPCQPFSRAGKRENVECDTGRLFTEFVRIVDDLRPRWMLFENVKGLTLTTTELLELSCETCARVCLAPFAARIGETDFSKLPCSSCGAFTIKPVYRKKRGGSLDIILNEFEALGYRCHATVLNAVNFGAPQLRERLIIVGSRDSETFSWPPCEFSKDVSNSLTQGDFFSPIARTQPWRTAYEVLWQEGHPEFGKLDKSKAVLWVKNVVRPHDEPVTWSLDRPSPTIGAHQAAKLALAPEGVPEEQLARQQWHVLGKRQGDTPPVPVKHTYLSDPELLAIQTFPSFWYLFGTRMQRAFQIGNAVPPLLAQAVGKAILSASGIPPAQRKHASA